MAAIAIGRVSPRSACGRRWVSRAVCWKPTSSIHPAISTARLPRSNSATSCGPRNASNRLMRCRCRCSATRPMQWPFWAWRPIIDGLPHPRRSTATSPARWAGRRPRHAPPTVTEKQDYKQTINLPETAFPMQAKLAEREPQTLARWLENDLYGEIQRATVGRPKFWFIDGPPYANGDIHIGHAVNKVLKDMIVKAARLDGFDRSEEHTTDLQ